MALAARKATPAPVAKPEMALSGLEKAAILVMYLDREVARGLLRRMNDEDVKQLGLAIAMVQNVEDAAVERIVGDFVVSLQGVSKLPFTGRDYARKVLPTIMDEDRRDTVVGAIHRRVGNDFDAFIRSRSPQAVAAILAEEHPQVQAVALLRMGPDNAARIIGCLGDEAQVDMTIRMARTEKVSGELADDVEESIRRALEDQDDPLPVGGHQVTARMLGRMPREKNVGVLTRMRDDGNDLADQLQRLMVVFEDLKVLDDRGIQALLRVVERTDLVLALKGATAPLRDKFLKNLSSRAAADLVEEIEMLGQARKSQIRAAQEAVTAAAQKLHEEGVIVLSVGAEEE